MGFSARAIEAKGKWPMNLPTERGGTRQPLYKFGMTNIQYGTYPEMTVAAA